MKLTHAAVAARLPLRAAAGTEGTKVPLLQAACGELAGTAQAAKAAALGEGDPRFLLSSRMALRRAPGRGRGWFAARALAAGTVVLVERPLAAVLDLEWRGQPWADCDSSDSAALEMELARRFSPSATEVLAGLHPPEDAVHALPAGDGAEPPKDEDEEDEEEAAMLAEVVGEAWAAVEGLSDPARRRLQAVVRLNSLGFYTHSEQLCHHGNFSALMGSGLYALASGFNHSCDPCVARFSIGDVTSFATNRPVPAGEELCISYIENELLCAPKSLRAQSLNRDFSCGCARCADASLEPEPSAGARRQFLHVDAQVQAQLALLSPEERVQAAEAALRGEMGGASEEEESEEEGDTARSPAVTVVLGKDAQELRVVQALALVQLQQHDAALAVWRRLAAFSCHHCPPFDESVPVYAIHAALSAFAGGHDKAALEYVSIALRAHRGAFGGVPQFRWRYRREVELAAVPAEVRQQLWAAVDACGEAASTGAAPWAEVTAAWRFRAEDIPLACDTV